MPEYRIVTKIDPQTSAGAAKTKQDLASIEAQARSTGKTMDTAVAGPAGKAAAGQEKLAKSTEQATRSMDSARRMFGQTSMSVTDLTSVLAVNRREQEALNKTTQTTGTTMSSVLGKSGIAGAAAGFIGGAFGIAISMAATALVNMAVKALEAGDSVEDLVDKMKKDAEETAKAERAKAAYAMTLEGVTAAVRESEKALKELQEADRTQAQQASIQARMGVLRIEQIKAETQALIDNARALLEVARARATGPTQQAELAALGLADRQRSLDALEARMGKINSALDSARAAYREIRSFRDVELGQEMATEEGRINRLYDQRIEQKRVELVAQKATNEEIRKQTRLLEEAREAELKLARERDKKPKATSDGVSRFRSREQAIGIAGRELQSGGLRVGENNQFGGVKYNHPGMGNAAHGRFAVDVNAPGSVVEANVPHLKAKFDALARLYQSRGYRVLWAGQVWEANGNGPSGPIKGANKHFDHMHLEAPATIVGKATQAGTAAALMREQDAAANVAEQQADFISGVVAQQAGRGVPNNAAAESQARLDKVYADFERRFNQAMSPEQRQKVAEAFDAGDARETAEHFRQAYVLPLEELEAQLGATGMQREINRRILEETIARGRELTDVERGQIETSVRYGDQLVRMIDILDEINGPIEHYTQQVAALEALLSKGRISQEGFNAQIAALQGPARDVIAGMPQDQIDPNSGLSYGDLGETLDENARYAQQLADLQTHRQALLDMNINYNALEAAAKSEHEQRLAAIEQRRRSTQIMAASSLFDSLANIAETGMGKQNAIYKAMFVASKAFAIADSVIKIQKAMAEALALPFPANLPALAQVAALGAGIISNIQAVSLNLADGGLIRGPGGPRGDKIPVNASDGEFMVNAAATRRNRALLEAINNGAVVDRQRRQAGQDRAVSETAGGDTLSFSFGDVVVQAGSATAEDGEVIGNDVKRAIGALIDEKLAKESRSGGRLTRTRQSVMTS